MKAWRNYVAPLQEDDGEGGGSSLEPVMGNAIYCKGHKIRRCRVLDGRKSKSLQAANWHLLYHNKVDHV